MYSLSPRSNRIRAVVITALLLIAVAATMIVGMYVWQHGYSQSASAMLADAERYRAMSTYATAHAEELKALSQTILAAGGAAIPIGIAILIIFSSTLVVSIALAIYRIMTTWAQICLRRITSHESHSAYLAPIGSVVGRHLASAGFGIIPDSNRPDRTRIPAPAPITAPGSGGVAPHNAGAGEEHGEDIGTDYHSHPYLSDED